ncbi:MAG: hypothetical protein IJX38_02025 [Clostridia bacterium]|nr:hypothetical protein [Clostridia bacterium]
MGLGFKRFKRRLLLTAILKSASIAACAALIAGAGITVLTKFVGLTMPLSDLVMYALACGSAFLLAFAISGVAMFPTNKRVARRIDSALDFKERTQTMLEFMDDDGPVAAAQREDTDKRLQRAPLGAVRTTVKRIVALALALVISAGALTGALVIPAAEPAADDGASDIPEEEPNVDESNKQRLIDIINDIIYRLENPSKEKSPYFDDDLQFSLVNVQYMDASLKGLTVEYLGDLVTEIEAAEKFSVMKRAAITAVRKVSKDYTVKNTYEALGASFSESGTRLIKELGDAITALDRNGVGNSISGIGSEIEVMFYNEDYNGAMVYVDGISAAINRSKIGNEDPLRSALTVYQAAVRKAIKASDASTVTDATKAASRAARDAIQQQIYNAGVIPVVIEMLMRTFNISLEDLAEHADEIPEELLPPPPDDEDKDDEEEEDGEDEDDMDVEQEGGAGSGNVNYAGDDLVYWHPTQSYVKYSEILAIIEAATEEELAGKEIDPALAEAIDQFFALLYNDNKLEKTTN